VSDIDVYKAWLGIPEGDRPPDHYTLLRLVMFEDDPDKVRNNYRKLNGHVRKFATGQYLKQSQDLLNEIAKAMLSLTDPDSKREYDASLGREPTEAITTDEAKTTLQYLINKGILKRSQVAEIEHFADARGLSHRDAVIQMKLAESVEATQGLATELRMPYVDLDDMLPEDDVLDGLPRNVVKRHSCLPLFEDGGRLLVACANEPHPDLEDEIRMRYGMPMRGVLALPRQINQAIAKHYAPGTRTETEPVGDGATESSSSGKKSRKQNNATKNATAQKANIPLTDDEKTNRRNISLIAICWSVIAPMVAMNTLTEFSVMTQAGITAPIAVLVTIALKLSYWK
jgi:hypothetical protein